MEEMEARQESFPATLDTYVQQGQMFLYNAAQNLIQYGRVLTEAKPLVPRGQFERWVQVNFNMSERSAQGYMQVWRRFGGNRELSGVRFSNLQKMLALPEGTEAQFAKENDLEAMTARQVEQAVKKVREESEAAINREKGARLKAEMRLQEAEAKNAEPDKALLAAVAEKDSQIREYQRQAEKAMQESTAAKAELENAKEELSEMEEALTDQQAEYNRLQGELLNAQSAIARGDAERVISGGFTLDDFSAAVRNFIGSVAQMPYLSDYFGSLVDQDEYRQWDSLLAIIEDWTIKARKAMETVTTEGGIIDG